MFCLKNRVKHDLQFSLGIRLNIKSRTPFSLKIVAGDDMGLQVLRSEFFGTLLVLLGLDAHEVEL